MRKTINHPLGAVLSLLVMLAVTLSTAAQAACVNPPSGLVSWWRAEGNVLDAIGSHNGQVQGGVGFAAGRVGQAFNFDGFDYSVIVPHSEDFNPAGPFSVECWIQADPDQYTWDGYFLIVDKSHGFTDYTGWVIQGNPDGTVGFGFGDGSGWAPGVVSLMSVLDNQWHHLAGVFTGPAVEFYVDGVLQGSAPQSSLPAGNNRPVEIGQAWGGGFPMRFFHGLIDEVSYYRRALSAAEVQSIYTAGAAGKCAPPASALQWQVFFEDNFDGSAIDGSIWNTELATSGKRWCQSTINGSSPPLVWQDVSVEPWNGVTETPPYGTVAVGGGLASFSAGILRAFPYIWCGTPSRSSPFPATGDFIYEFRWRLDSPGQHGNGVITPFWPNTEPEGDNSPFAPGWGLWGDSRSGWSMWSIAGSVTVPNPQQFHIFRLEHINGAYSLYVDGILRAGATESGWRPNVIWIGNPVFAWWSQPWDNWSDFTIDYIRVLAPIRGCPNASFADDAIIWHQPLARNGASEDTDPSAGRTVKYRFKRGSTIPIQIHALNCAGADVTSNANVIGKVTVFGDSNCGGATDDNAAPIDFNGVGGGGGMMDKIGGHLKYNLDTKSLPTTTQCYILRVTVADTSTGEEKFEEVLLQAK